jgi:4-hydroxy-2-oxoheptanedioate aldolase
MGIIAPHIEDAKSVEEVVRHCYYAPLGERSFPGAWPQFSYDSVQADIAVESLNRSTAVIAMIESQAGLDALDEIAAVPGLTAIHIGTNDLCQDLGIVGQLDHPKVIDIYRDVNATCRKRGVPVGAGGCPASQPL